MMSQHGREAGLEAGHSPLALKTNSTPSSSQGENELDATQSSNEGDREGLECTQHATKTKANQIFTALSDVMLAAIGKHYKGVRSVWKQVGVRGGGREGGMTHHHWRRGGQNAK